MTAQPLHPRRWRPARSAVFAAAMLCASSAWSSSADERSIDLEIIGTRTAEVDSALHVGTVSFLARPSARVLESATQVRFLLDGRLVVQRRAQPYTASIHLGRAPSVRVVSVEALDAQGSVLAVRELVLNRRHNVFDLRFVAPNPGIPKQESVRVALDLSLPESGVLDAVDLFRGEEQVASLRDGTLETLVEVSPDRTTFLRAVARLQDGRSREAVVFLGSADLIEEFDVQYVQLDLLVRERRGNRPVLDLDRSELLIREDGVEQDLLRFDRVQDLPLSLCVLLDTSASMKPRMEKSARAAGQFFSDTMRPGDRATLITFNDRPTLQVPLTEDRERLATALESAEAVRGTALYDSLVYALYQLAAIEDGQRAVLMLSDGHDETSVLRYQDALRYAQRAGLPIYSVRIDQGRDSRRARQELEELASVTGGRAFFVKDIGELEAVYREISNELRSRYLATYQSNQRSSSPRFRTVEVEVDRRGVAVSTQSGYYP